MAKRWEIRSLASGKGHWGHKGIPGHRGGSLPGKGGGASGGGDDGWGSTIPPNSKYGGYVFDYKRPKTLESALEKGGWKISSRDDTGVFTKWKRVDDKRAMRLLVISDMVKAHVGELTNGAIAAGTPLKVHNLHNDEIPSPIDLKSWITNDLLD